MTSPRQKITQEIMLEALRHLGIEPSKTMGTVITAGEIKVIRPEGYEDYYIDVVESLEPEEEEPVEGVIV